MSDDAVARALLTNYQPTLRQRFGDAVYDVARALMPSTANRMREEAGVVADFIPGLGDALGVGDAYSNFQAGNYGQAAADLGLVAIGAVPAVGDAAARGIRVWTGGAGDPVKAAKDKGAWFSEAKDLADEYAHGGGRVTGAYIQPKNPIEFRHAEQERTIGDFISTALEGAGSDLDVERLEPIVDSLRAKYGDEARPLFEYWNNDPEIAGFLRALGYDSISVAEKGDMKSKTWAALDPSIFQADRSFLPSSASLNIPRAPSIEELSSLARMEDVPVSQLRGSQPTMNWDGYNRGEYGDPLFGDFSMQPVVARRNDGEYIVFDGHHRSVSAMNNGAETIPAWVIDAAEYDPANAGRRIVDDAVDDDALLKALGL